jgi:hypothetical protein
MDWPIMLGENRNQESTALNALSAASDKDTPLAVTAILVCGFPGQRLGAVIEFVRQSFVRAVGNCAVINVNAITDEVLNAIETGEGPMLLWADCPEPSVVRWCRSSATPILLVNVPFEETSMEFMAFRKASLTDCARVLARARICWWQLAQLRSSIIVDLAGDIGAAVAPFLATLQLASSPSDFPAVNGNGLEGGNMPPLQWHAESIAQLGLFYGKSNSSEACELTIPLRIFFDGAPPHLPLSGSIDLIGPVRCLSFGPFLYLPQGQWMLSFSFEASMNRSGNSLMFDIFVDDESKCKTEFQLTHDGCFEFECEFVVRDPSSTFEFRSHLRRGAIEGQLTPLSLHIRRI